MKKRDYSRSSLKPKTETLRGVYPEPKDEILHFVQDDRRRRAQDDQCKTQNGKNWMTDFWH